MNLETNIEIAAEVYFKENGYNENSGEELAFIAGAKSDEAKEYWYKQFQRERVVSELGLAGHKDNPRMILIGGGMIGSTEVSRAIEILEEKGMRGQMVCWGNEDVPALQALIDREPIRLREQMEFKITRMPEIEPLRSCIPDRQPKPYDRKNMPNRQFKKRK